MPQSSLIPLKDVVDDPGTSAADPFFESYRRFNDAFKSQFKRDLRITGGATEMHLRPSLGGKAVDAGRKDLSPDMESWIDANAEKYGLHTIKATGKESWATAPHYHFEAGRAMRAGLIPLDNVIPDEQSAAASEPVRVASAPAAEASAPKIAGTDPATGQPV